MQEQDQCESQMKDDDNYFTFERLPNAERSPSEKFKYSSNDHQMQQNLKLSGLHTNSLKKQQKQQKFDNLGYPHNKDEFHNELSKPGSKSIPKPQPNSNSEQFLQNLHQNDKKQFNGSISRRKLLQSISLLNIQIGDYVQIHMNTGKFAPVYKIQAKNVNVNKKEDVNEVDNQRKTVALSKLQLNLKNNFQSNKLDSCGWDLGIGSRIFLKYQNFMYRGRYQLKKLKKLPMLNTIYVYLFIPRKGFLTCPSLNNLSTSFDSQQIESSIEYEKELEYKVQNIWKCVMCPALTNNNKDNEHHSRQFIFEISGNQQSFDVYFESFLSGQFLGVNLQGQFISVDEYSSENCRFCLQKSSSSDVQNIFHIQRSRHSGSKGPHYRSYEWTKKHFNQNSNKNSFFSQIKLIPQEQNFIDLQSNLVYLKQRLLQDGDLKLIELCLETLTPYYISEFLHDFSIISEDIQKIFYEEKISELMRNCLIKLYQENQTQKSQSKKDKIKNIAEQDQKGHQEHIHLNNTLGSRSVRNIQNIQTNHKNIPKDQRNPHKNSKIMKIIKILNRLCMNNKQNSGIFIPLLDYFFTAPLVYFDEILVLLNDNAYFTSAFYRKQWYHKLIQGIMTISSGNQTSDGMRSIQKYFLILNKFCVVGRFGHFDNQFLLFHTFKQTEFEDRNVLLKLYVDDSYIFIHENNKDLELLTYLEMLTSRNQRQNDQNTSNLKNQNNTKSQINLQQKHRMHLQQKHRKRLSLIQKGPSLLSGLDEVILFLVSVHSLSYGYNYLILKEYQKFMYSLMSYCYKQKFPVIKQFDFIAWVLRCLVSFYQPEYLQLCIYPQFRVGLIDSVTSENKFNKKPENSFYPFINKLFLSIRNCSEPPKLPKKQSLQMCQRFLLKCKEYYQLVKSSQIGIEQIFQTKCIKGEPVEEYFDFLKTVFCSRMMKFKEKKKAQFIQHIEKLFGGIKEKQDNEMKEENLIHIFTNFIVQILAYHYQYQQYLQFKDVKVNYNQNIVQNALINKKMAVKRLILFNYDQDQSKITKIKYFRPKIQLNSSHKNHRKGSINERQKKSSLKNINSSKSLKSQQNMKEQKQKSSKFCKYFQQQNQKHNQRRIFGQQQQKNNQINYDIYSSHTNGNFIREKNTIDNQFLGDKQFNNNDKIIPNAEYEDQLNLFAEIDLIESAQHEQAYLSLKRRTIELLYLIFLNINEEYLEESVQTLNYFLKNPTILNWKTFGLFDSIPKYDNEYSIKKHILEQWYLASDQEYFQSLTSMLCLLMNKTSIHVNKLNMIEIVTDSEMSQIANEVSRAFQQINKLTKSVDSWFKEQLFTANNHLFTYFYEKLSTICLMIEKFIKLTDSGCVSVAFQLKRILVNLNCFEWLLIIIRHVNAELKMIGLLSGQTNYGLKKNNRNNYEENINNFVIKIMEILRFITKPIQLDKLNPSQGADDDVYRLEYEMGLFYLHAAICVLGEELSKGQCITLLIEIIEIGRTHYNLNLAIFISDQILQRIFHSEFQSFFGMLPLFKQNQIFELSNRYFKFLRGLNSEQLNQMMLILTAGEYNDKLMEIRHKSSNYLPKIKYLRDAQQNGKNVWLYFIYKLVCECKQRYKSSPSRVPLLKYFFSWLFIPILMNQSHNKDDLLIKKCKFATELPKPKSFKNSQIPKIKAQITRRRFLCYFCVGYVQNESYLNLSMRNNSQFLVIQEYVTDMLVDLWLYDKIQKLAIKENSRKQPRSRIVQQIQALILDFVEYYVYDLTSLLHFLNQSDLFQKIYDNLARINDKLVFFFKNTKIGNIQRHCSKQAIEQVLKLLQDRKPIPRLKDPRQSFEQPLHYSCVNVKNIKFMTSKQINKKQATARRKWKKAVKALDVFNYEANSEQGLLYEMQVFCQIYAFKQKQSINQVINNEDLFRKLFSTLKNVNLLLKRTQNRIFIMSQIRKFINSKYFQCVVCLEQSRQILGEMFMETLNENQLVGEENSIQNCCAWRLNLFQICMKLQIIKELNYFANEYTLVSFEILLDLLRKSQKCFFYDYLKISIAKDQFKEVKIGLEPFYLILEIINDQISFLNIRDDFLRFIAENLFQCLIHQKHAAEYEWFQNEDRSSSKHFQHQRIQLKLIQKFIKHNKQHLFKQILQQKCQNTEICYLMLMKIQQYEGNNKNLNMVINVSKVGNGKL